MYQGDTFSRRWNSCMAPQAVTVHGVVTMGSSSHWDAAFRVSHIHLITSFPSPDATWAPISIYVAVYWGLLHGLRSHAPRAREFPATISFGFPTHRTCGMGLTLSFSPPTFFPAPVHKVSDQLPFNWCFTLIYLVQEVDGDSNFLLANAF